LEGWGIHTIEADYVARPATGNMLDVAGYSYAEPYNVLSMYYFDSGKPVPLPFRFLGKVSHEVAANTLAETCELGSWGDVDVAEDVYFTYASKITVEADLLSRQEILVVMGACSLLLGGTVIPRTQDPGARTDRTVQPGQTSRDSRWFQQEFFIKARTEAALLAIERNNVPGTLQTKRAQRWRN
jgi:hypothetical protein